MYSTLRKKNDLVIETAWNVTLFSRPVAAPPSDRKKNWPRGYKTFFMLNSVEHEILNAHKYKNIKKFRFF